MTGVDASTPEAVLEFLKPSLRRIVEDLDPGLLPAFDVVYDIGALDLVRTHLRSTSERDELAGRQHLGLSPRARDNLVAFLINIAATLTLEVGSRAVPRTCTWLTQPSTQRHAPSEPSDVVGRILRSADLSEADKGRVERAMRHDQTLMRILRSVGQP